MLNDKELIKTSRFLSLILRHKPETIGISLDKNGWAKVSHVIKGMREQGYTINHEILEKIVNTDDKQRYSFDTHKTRKILTFLFLKEKRRQIMMLISAVIMHAGMHYRRKILKKLKN